MKKRKLPKEPSLLSKFIDIQVERYKTHKALRIMSQQEWSVEFLTAMIVRASNVTRQQLEITLVNKSGHAIKISTVDAPETSVFRDDSIFNHLDDELKIKEFISKVNSR